MLKEKKTRRSFAHQTDFAGAPGEMFLTRFGQGGGGKMPPWGFLLNISKTV